MKNKIFTLFLSVALIIVFGSFNSNEASAKTITDHDIELANLAARVYPGYFDALSMITTIFTVPKIDFDNNTRDWEMLEYWGGSPDGALGEVPFHKTGCDAALFHKASTGKYVLSFRGTTAQIQDLLEDFALLLHAPEGLFGAYNQFIEADEIIMPQIIDEYGYSILNNLEITGHSLGGALAQAIGVKYGLPATSFNGVGLPDQALWAIGVYKDEIFWENVQNIVHINVSKDPMTDWNWDQDAYSFWDTLPRYGKNYWLPAKYNSIGSCLRNHYYNVIVHQMGRYESMQYGESILSD